MWADKGEQWTVQDSWQQSIIVPSYIFTEEYYCINVWIWFQTVMVLLWNKSQWFASFCQIDIRAVTKKKLIRSLVLNLGSQQFQIRFDDDRLMNVDHCPCTFCKPALFPEDVISTGFWLMWLADCLSVFLSNPEACLDSPLRASLRKAAPEKVGGS